MILICTFALGLNSRAQSYLKTDLGIKSAIDSIGIEIQFFSPTIVRVLKWPEGKEPMKNSLSVIKTPEKTNFSVRKKGDNLSLKSKSLIVELNLKNGEVSFLSSSNKSLLTEQKAGSTFTDFDDAGVKTYSAYQSFVLDKDEAIYGLGQQQQGKMEQRNVKLNMVQGNTDDYVPFFRFSKRLRFILG